MSRERPFWNSRLELDDERCEALWQGQRLELSGECYAILQVLARAPGKIHAPYELIDQLYDDAKTSGDYSKLDLACRIKEIKFAFTHIGSYRGFIETVPRRGYKWSEPSPSVLGTLLGFLRRTRS